MTILAVVLGTMYRGLDSIQRTAAGSQERLEALDEARILMASITKDLRTAVRLSSDTSPFTLAADRQLTFYANINNAATGAPRRVNIFVDSENRLVEQLTDPSGTAPNYTFTATPSVRVIGSFVWVPPAPAPAPAIFRYYSFDQSTGQYTQLTSTPLSAADLLKVESVEVEISIRKGQVFTTRPTTLINRVRLPNLDYNPGVAP